MKTERKNGKEERSWKKERDKRGGKIKEKKLWSKLEENLMEDKNYMDVMAC